MPRILICDDEPGVRKFIREVLEAEGHAVRETDGWKSCLEALHDQPADLLFLDLNLPEVTGEQILDALGTTRPRVVVITGAGTERADEAFVKHRVRILMKPFTSYEILEAVRIDLGGTFGSSRQ